MTTVQTLPLVVAQSGASTALSTHRVPGDLEEKTFRSNL